MLRLLKISNFALIDELEIEFGKGLNILSGETGAGKSIIIGALSLLLGARSQAEYVRDREKKTYVEGVFDIDLTQFKRELLMENNIEFEDDGFLILSREIRDNGKSIARINGNPANLSLLKKIATAFVNIYGQHDFQVLSNPENHLHILDSVGSNEFFEKKLELKEAYLDMRRAEKRLKDFQRDIQSRKEWEEYIKFQINEIDGLEIKSEDEDEKIDKELAILENREKIKKTSSKVLGSLDGNGSAYESLGVSFAEMDKLVEFVPDLQAQRDRMSQVYYELEDIISELRGYSELDRLDTDGLESLNERKYNLTKIKNKYSLSLKEILLKRDELEKELNMIVNFDEEIETLEKNFRTKELTFMEKSTIISKERKEISDILEYKIKEELFQLGMKDLSFKCNFEKISSNENGFDKIEFLISTNLGEELKPISKIASGGEMSRIMLALKAILSNDDLETLIFDEVDSGIDGETIKSVANKLKFISEDKQVISVTHSPLIAAFSDIHFHIKKVSENSRTLTKVKRICEEEKVREIARMLGDQTDAGIEFSQKLINGWS